MDNRKFSLYKRCKFMFSSIFLNRNCRYPRPCRRTIKIPFLGLNVCVRYFLDLYNSKLLPHALADGWLFAHRTLHRLILYIFSRSGNTGPLPCRSYNRLCRTQSCLCILCMFFSTRMAYDGKGYQRGKTR